MRLVVGVMDSAHGLFSEGTETKLGQGGRAIAEQDCVLISGGCSGLPYAAVQGARAAGGLVIGISPGLSRDEHVAGFQSPGRNTTSTRTAAAGRWCRARRETGARDVATAVAVVKAWAPFVRGSGLSKKVSP